MPTEIFFRDGHADLFPGEFREALFGEVLDAIDWRSEQIRMFGKLHTVPRLVAYYGAPGYAYSGTYHEPRALPEVLAGMQRRVEELAEHRFNAVLCNYYRNGRDSMGYHRDNEPEIDGRCIASVSLGATRRFKFRHRMTREVISIDLPGGSVLTMRDCQELWEHALVKTRKPVGGRINLTFRYVRPAEDAGR